LPPSHVQSQVRDKRRERERNYGLGGTFSRPIPLSREWVRAHLPLVARGPTVRWSPCLGGATVCEGPDCRLCGNERRVVARDSKSPASWPGLEIARRDNGLGRRLLHQRLLVLAVGGLRPPPRALARGGSVSLDPFGSGMRRTGGVSPHRRADAPLV